MKYQILIIGIILCVLSKFQGQSTGNQIIYPQRVLLAEEAIAIENFDEALFQYQQLFKTSSFVLAKDAFNACQVAALQSSVDFRTYYAQCAKSGIPTAFLLRSPKIRARFERDSSTLNAVYKVGYSLYIARIDTSLRSEFIARYQLEQNSKGKENYATVCENNFNRIVELAKANRFPGENLIGPHESLETNYVFPTLLHYPYSFIALKSYLLEAINLGHVSPFAVCYLYGFNQTRTSVLYTRDIPVDNVNFKENYNLPFGEQSTDIVEVNAQRKLRYLPSIETEQKLKAVALKYKLNYQQGY